MRNYEKESGEVVWICAACKRPITPEDEVWVQSAAYHVECAPEQEDYDA